MMVVLLGTIKSVLYPEISKVNIKTDMDNTDGLYNCPVSLFINVVLEWSSLYSLRAELLSFGIYF